MDARCTMFFFCCCVFGRVDWGALFPGAWTQICTEYHLGVFCVFCAYYCRFRMHAKQSVTRTNARTSEMQISTKINTGGMRCNQKRTRSRSCVNQQTVYGPRHSESRARGALTENGDTHTQNGTPRYRHDVPWKLLTRSADKWQHIFSNARNCRLCRLAHFHWLFSICQNEHLRLRTRLFRA